jgi:RNA polymerase sigma-70 factor (ECF subfamily)
MSEHHQNEDAFLAAYDEYNDAIFRFCLVKTRNRDVALDITQDTFTKTWEYLADGKKVDNIRAFLYQVARNLIIDNSRKKKSLSLDAALEEGQDFGVDTQERTENIIDGKKSVELLDQLKDKDRDVLVMRFIEDMSVPEIAEALKEKENTISVRIHRALNKAQDLLENLNTYEQQ